MKPYIPLLLTPLLLGCSSDDNDNPPPLEPTPEMQLDSCYQLHTSKGTVQIGIDRTNTPKTGDNFHAYADRGFYDGTLFHRVIAEFMIQGGGFEPGMNAKPTDPPISNEAHVGFTNARGTLAMARTQAPHSATAQFFINHVDNPLLDRAHAADGWGYAVFGRVLSGMDVVDQIAIVATGPVGGHANVPLTDVMIDYIVSTDCPTAQ
ncbi:peptidylprolyl isomerase [Ferrimonas pelagia]|uniref:Peptidyl-prolyl cis-trans isomerase n=1 Tax=Ferrimonas pelagia TaxID=1177826 RepID=A0ABP9EKR6_9GAMM